MPKANKRMRTHHTRSSEFPERRAEAMRLRSQNGYNVLAGMCGASDLSKTTEGGGPSLEARDRNVVGGSKRKMGVTRANEMN